MQEGVCRTEFVVSALLTIRASTCEKGAADTTTNQTVCSRLTAGAWAGWLQAFDTCYETAQARNEDEQACMQLVSNRLACRRRKVHIQLL
jgi:hypothetical protein